MADTTPQSTHKNHGSAINHSHVIEDYISKEISYGATAGPFTADPLEGHLVISPLQTVPKKGTTSGERRVVHDLSFPPAASVNHGIPKQSYLGVEFELHYPTIDNFSTLIINKGPGCLMFKRDLRRAYRQIPVDPYDYNMLGFKWMDYTYFDTVLPFGLRSASMACQRTTNAVVYAYEKLGYSAVNYIDDLASAEKPDIADQAYINLAELLASLGLEEAPDKAIPPTTQMVFVGILCDSVKMTLEVTPERLTDISAELDQWLDKRKATKRQIQSLVGKLNFVAKCVRPGRIFLSRILQALCGLRRNSHFIYLNKEFRKDLLWWRKFMANFNGVAMIKEQDKSVAVNLATDACLQGAGGVYNNQFFTSPFPNHLLKQQLHISALEFLTVVVAVKI